MSSSTHHIQTNRYNRTLQIAPKNRVSRTFKIIEKALKKRTSYGAVVVDHMSAAERENTNMIIRRERTKDIRRSMAAVALFITLVIVILFSLDLL